MMLLMVNIYIFNYFISLKFHFNILIFLINIYIFQKRIRIRIRIFQKYFFISSQPQRAAE